MQERGRSGWCIIFVQVQEPRPNLSSYFPHLSEQSGPVARFKRFSLENALIGFLKIRLSLPSELPEPYRVGSRTDYHLISCSGNVWSTSL